LCIGLRIFRNPRLTLRCYNRRVRFDLILGLAYLAAVLASREWRVVAYHTLFRTPWREIAHGSFEAFPSSHWRGASRIVGVPFAWYFAGLIIAVMALFFIGLEVIFSPRAVYCSLVRLSHRCRGWFTQPPGHTPPRAAAYAMPRPEPPLVVDAVSRIRVRR
jgi:hypothetical protein